MPNGQNAPAELVGAPRPLVASGHVGTGSPPTSADTIEENDMNTQHETPDAPSTRDNTRRPGSAFRRDG